MKILISGAGGQIGRSLVTLAPSYGMYAVGLPRQLLNVTDAQQVSQCVAGLRPALIINAAAYTNLDHAEAEVAQARAVNHRGAAHLAKAAADAGIPLFHLSSEYVFAGDGERPYRESDPAEPCSVYGATRLAGEQAISKLLARHIILRSSWIYGEYGNNFVNTMLKLGGRSEALSVVSDQIGCPTRSRGIARVLLELADRYRRDGDLAWGTYHYSGSSPCSWYEFAEEIFTQAERSGLLRERPVIIPVSSASLPRRAPRPRWSVLDCGRIQEAFGIPIRPWHEELRHVIERLGEMPFVPLRPQPSRVPFRLHP